MGDSVVHSCPGLLPPQNLRVGRKGTCRLVGRVAACSGRMNMALKGSEDLGFFPQLQLSFGVLPG